MSDKLKPCPFCGRGPKLIPRYCLGYIGDGIKCKCGIKTPKLLVGERAVKAWNTRVVPNLEQENVRLREENTRLKNRVVQYDEKLLNAFQLVKNGIQIGYLKYSEFTEFLEQRLDHKGVPVDEWSRYPASRESSLIPTLTKDGVDGICPECGRREVGAYDSRPKLTINTCGNCGYFIPHTHGPEGSSWGLCKVRKELHPNSNWVECTSWVIK